MRVTIISEACVIVFTAIFSSVVSCLQLSTTWTSEKIMWFKLTYAYLKWKLFTTWSGLLAYGNVIKIGFQSISLLIAEFKLSKE